MTTTMTTKQVEARILSTQEKDPLGAILTRIDTLDNVYVAGDEHSTYANVVAMINFFLERKRLLEAEN
jgi:hypothetical protein